jgi:hypothetical protein
MQVSGEFMLGVSPRCAELTQADIALMQAAGISWIRFSDFRFDVVAFLEGRTQPADFHAAEARLRELHACGFKFIGITPGPVAMAASALPTASPEYFDAYARVSRFFARKFGDIIEWWQVANELDIWIFRDTLSLDQSVEFLKTGIRAMKDEAPQLNVGVNVTLFPSLPGEVDGNTEAHEGLAIANGIYGDPSIPVDFAGLDSYPGCWREGGPESWAEYLDDFYALTGKQILIMEFGYASAGGIMDEAEIAQGLYPCEAKKWKYSWRGEHSPERQADYIREAMKVFSTRPFVLGALYYNWRDAPQCWQCKQKDCPAETAWGLLDQDGMPKLSYAAIRESALAMI